LDFALVDVDLAVGSGKSGSIAKAVERVDSVDTGSVVQAGFRLALINVDLAESSCKSRLAGAGEVVDAVNTGGAILALVGGALVDVNLAVDAFESGSAGTLVRVDKVVADTVVLARPRQALIKIVVTVVPGKTWPTVALIGSLGVPTDPVVAEVLGDGALVNVLGAGQAGPPRGAGALEPVGFIQAAGAVLARI